MPVHLIRIYMETGIFEVKKEGSQSSDGLQNGSHLISLTTCMSIHGPPTINKLRNLGEVQNTIFFVRKKFFQLKREFD